MAAAQLSLDSCSEDAVSILNKLILQSFRPAQGHLVNLEYSEVPTVVGNFVLAVSVFGRTFQGQPRTTMGLLNRRRAGMLCRLASLSMYLPG